MWLFMWKTNGSVCNGWEMMHTLLENDKLPCVHVPLFLPMEDQDPWAYRLDDAQKPQPSFKALVTINNGGGTVHGNDAKRTSNPNQGGEDSANEQVTTMIDPSERL